MSINNRILLAGTVKRSETFTKTFDKNKNSSLYQGKNKTLTADSVTLQKPKYETNTKTNSFA